MDDLRKALADIGEIRSQVARESAFRAYGPATVAATGALSLAAGAAQAVLIPDPVGDATSFLTLWIGVAAASIALIGVETFTRSRRLHSRLADDMIAAAVEQLMPAGVAGALLTAVLYRFSPENLWMLPGLWQVLFSLGIFASSRSLPRSVFAAGVWYLLCGLSCLAFARGEHALSPWAMAVPFGVGQLLTALLIHRSLGDDHGQ